MTRDYTDSLDWELILLGQTQNALSGFFLPFRISKGKKRNLSALLSVVLSVRPPIYLSVLLCLNNKQNSRNHTTHGNELIWLYFTWSFVINTVVTLPTLRSKKGTTVSLLWGEPIGHKATCMGAALGCMFLISVCMHIVCTCTVSALKAVRRSYS